MASKPPMMIFVSRWLNILLTIKTTATSRFFSAIIVPTCQQLRCYIDTTIHKVTDTGSERNTVSFLF
jgi:cytolysin (calcineurin-like family phosphatase)